MTSRERFEASGITSLLSRNTEPGFADEYADSHTQFAWMAWQAAERQALERAAQECAKQTRESHRFEFIGYNQSSKDCAAAIRALKEAK